jgi:signal transduction histidine kinase
MEIVLLIVAALLLWGILKALKRAAGVETEKSIIKHAETAVKSAAESLVNVLKPIADKFEQAKAEGHTLEWADRYLTTMANVTKQDYWEMVAGLKKHGLGPDPEYQRAIDEESKRRGLPCKYSVDEEEWKRAWTTCEYPNAELDDYSYSVCGCAHSDTYNTQKLADNYDGLQLWTLDLKPYDTCPFCGKHCETWKNYDWEGTRFSAEKAAERALEAARWKDFAQRHPEKAAEIEAKAKRDFLDERRRMARELDEKVKAFRAKG